MKTNLYCNYYFFNNKTTISTLNLKQQISNEKFKNLKF